MRRWVHDNALSLAMFGLFGVFIVAQSVAGWRANNEELTEQGAAALSYLPYLGSGHFIEATFENWESEFLQMGIYVLLTAYLVQRGSAESKPVKGEGTDGAGQARPDSPWPVRRGGWALRLYANSLSTALLLLFVVSFALHLLGGTAEYNQRQELAGQPRVGVLDFLFTSEFWFQSMQNWQSEFLAVGALVVLSVFLRQRGSSQSKPVEAPHAETG